MRYCSRYRHERVANCLHTLDGTDVVRQVYVVTMQWLYIPNSDRQFLTQSIVNKFSQCRQRRYVLCVVPNQRIPCVLITIEPQLPQQYGIISVEYAKLRLNTGKTARSSDGPRSACPGQAAAGRCMRVARWSGRLYDEWSPSADQFGQRIARSVWQLWKHCKRHPAPVVERT